MELLRAYVKNFRLLYDVKISFDKNTTLIVGKNNSGKTSLSSIFNLFLNERCKFSFEDFSIESHKKFQELLIKYKENIDENIDENIIETIEDQIPKIQLYLVIKYHDNEDIWSNIKPFITELDDENNETTILFEYAPENTTEFFSFLSKQIKDWNEDENLNKLIIEKISEHYKNYYKTFIRSYSDSKNTNNNISYENIEKLIYAKFINAQRTLDDSNSESTSKLSKIFENQFHLENKKSESSTNKLVNEIEAASKNIDGQLESFFYSFVESFTTFGFPNIEKNEIILKSKLNTDVLFKNNIKMLYNHDGNMFSEKYNGLGYSNLIYIISQIINFYKEIEEIQNSTLNLLFIEEPEAHMHPQMQNVFIKNINKFINTFNLHIQTTITTHSSHILSNAQLESIRYFNRKNQHITKIKDLMEFNQQLSQEKTKKFLQQYLTLGNCDLFFADKAILFEGTTERLLLPVFIEKVDQENQENQKLSEQYIASIEVGDAYAVRFKELLEFLEIKALIITDIDSVKENTKEFIKIDNLNVLTTSNNTLKLWFPEKKNIQDLLNTNDEDKIQGNIRVAYQVNVSCSPNLKVRCGRSFEQAFTIENATYLYQNKNKLSIIKNKLLNFSENDFFNKSDEVQDYIDKNKKKTDFAFDLLTISQEDWQVPSYIKEGLLWLAK